jgi:hypothetical protein
VRIFEFPLELFSSVFKPIGELVKQQYYHFCLFLSSEYDEYRAVLLSVLFVIFGSELLQAN